MPARRDADAPPTIQVIAQVPLPLRQATERLADKQGVSMSAVVRAALQEYVTTEETR